jgi:hypothetical protein
MGLVVGEDARGADYRTTRAVRVDADVSFYIIEFYALFYLLSPGK